MISETLPSSIEEAPEEPQEPPSIKRTNWVRKRIFKVSKKKWNDWHWQLKHCITNLGYENNEIQLPSSVTPYYYSHFCNNKNNPIALTVIPSNKELDITPDEKSDPLDEEKYSPVEGIIHKYPDRVLFLITNMCSVFCRYCCRSRCVGRKKDLTEKQIEEAINYIRVNKVIRDVLLSGGDCLTMETKQLESIIKRIRAIKHVEIIRIGTKVPVVLPQRITKELVNMLKKYAPLYININFIHPQEITKETEKACAMLVDNGIILGSQTVLLKDINDNAETMKKLMTNLVKIRVRPYYLYSMDRIAGGSHFAVPINTGKKIIQSLQWAITGFAVPKFVIDSPIGKIPADPDYITELDDGLLLNNHHGGTTIY